jgi:hypothetical protein
LVLSRDGIRLTVHCGSAKGNAEERGKSEKKTSGIVSFHNNDFCMAVPFGKQENGYTIVTFR